MSRIIILIALVLGTFITSAFAIGDPPEAPPPLGQSSSQPVNSGQLWRWALYHDGDQEGFEWINSGHNSRGFRRNRNGEPCYRPMLMRPRRLTRQNLNNQSRDEEALLNRAGITGENLPNNRITLHVMGTDPMELVELQAEYFFGEILPFGQQQQQQQQQQQRRVTGTVIIRNEDGRRIDNNAEINAETLWDLVPMGVEGMRIHVTRLGYAPVILERTTIRAVARAMTNRGGVVAAEVIIVILTYTARGYDPENPALGDYVGALLEEEEQQNAARQRAVENDDDMTPRTRPVNPAGTIPPRIIL